MLVGRTVSRKIRWQRAFATTAARSEVLDVAQLQDRIVPKYLGIHGSDPCYWRGTNPVQHLEQATFCPFNGHLLPEISS